MYFEITGNFHWGNGDGTCKYCNNKRLLKDGTYETITISSYSHYQRHLSSCLPYLKHDKEHILTSQKQQQRNQ